jgi:hypothetical protein
MTGQKPVTSLLTLNLHKLEEVVLSIKCSLILVVQSNFGFGLERNEECTVHQPIPKLAAIR